MTGTETTYPAVRSDTGFTITPVRTAHDLHATIALFTAYADWLNLDLSFQDFKTEMASMPGKYAPPTGDLLLAWDMVTSAPLGCVALRPLSSSGTDTGTSTGTGTTGAEDTRRICEMKRLYVSPLGRGRGVGKALAQAVIETARRLGYVEMKLDTLPRMAAARGLYEMFGFREIEPYYETPLEGTIFLGLPLD